MKYLQNNCLNYRQVKKREHVANEELFADLETQEDEPCVEDHEDDLQEAQDDLDVSADDDSNKKDEASADMSLEVGFDTHLWECDVNEAVEFEHI